MMVNFNPDGFVIANNSSRGTSQTLIAKKCAPPEKPVQFAPIGLLIPLVISVPFNYQLLSSTDDEKMSSLSVIMYIIGALISIVSIAFLYKKDLKSKELHKQKRKIWNNSWICLRCGQAWHYKL